VTQFQSGTFHHRHEYRLRRGTGFQPGRGRGTWRAATGVSPKRRRQQFLDADEAPGGSPTSRRRRRAFGNQTKPLFCRVSELNLGLFKTFKSPSAIITFRAEAFNG
jgi:hypothetical protein